MIIILKEKKMINKKSRKVNNLIGRKKNWRKILRISKLNVSKND